MPQSFRQDPNAVLDYLWDWSDWLDWLEAGDTIAEATVTVPAGLTLVETTVGNQMVTAWLGGVAVGASYRVACHIVTAAGREDERTITIVGREM